MDKSQVARLKPEPLDLAERAIDMERVAKIWLAGQKGEMGFNNISKELGLSRAYVKKLVNEFTLVYRNDDALRQRSKEVVGEFDQTIDNLKREMYRLAEDAENADDLKTRATVLKNIGDLEAKRVDTLQKSGLLANMDLAERIAEQEAQYDALKKIIIDILKDDPIKRTELARRLSIVEGVAQPTGNVVIVQE